jgi:predicted nucleic acid-binding protein
MNTTTEATTHSGYLLDGNMLVAINDETHSQFRKAITWVATHKTDKWFLCAVTEGTLLRLLMRTRGGARPVASDVWRILREFRARPNVVFIDAGFSYLDVQPKGLTGHKEVTDAWLITLARKHGCRLVTLDKGLSIRNPDIVDFVD